MSSSPRSDRRLDPSRARTHRAEGLPIGRRRRRAFAAGLLALAAMASVVGASAASGADRQASRPPAEAAAPGASCAASGVCAGGPIATASSAPGAWTSTRLPGLASELFLLGVSCPSESLCVATGTQNVIASSTDPTGGPAAWNVIYAGEGSYTSPSGPVISGRQIQGVSCPTAHLCVAVTTLGQIYATTEPTGPASAWSFIEPGGAGTGNTHLYGVSCPTASL
jgi:hypothetical protein